MKNNYNIARKNILSRLRKFPRVTEEPPENYLVPIGKKYSNEIKIKKFKNAIEKSHAEVYLCSEKNMLNVFISVIKSKKIKKIIYGEKNILKEKIVGECQKKTINIPEFVEYNQPIEEIKDLLFDADASITSTLGGIAETGTLILRPSPEEPRLMSLLPPVHFTVLYTKKIYNNFLEAINKEKLNKNMPSNLLLISGPSKTADIEQTLVYGVHGCKELVVFLIK